MPTGYTAKLMEEGQSFPEFAMTCARAFGALILMRDDPMDAPIPEEFQPSTYNERALAEAKTRLLMLEALEIGRETFGRLRKDEELASNRKWLSKELEENARLESMERLVRRWNPPTEDHSGLKEFMLQQIGVSKGHVDYIENLIAETEAKSDMDFYDEAVVSAKRDIEYHTEHMAKEIERADGRTEWVKQLRWSLFEATA